MRTSLYSILCIVIRLAAVVLAFNTLSKVPEVVVAWHQGTVGDARIVPAFALVALALLFAFLLWVYPGIIARLTASRSAREVFESPISPQQLQWIALSVLGMYFLLSAVIALVSYGVQWSLFAKEYLESEENRTEWFSDTIYWVVQLAFGVVLVLGARGFTGWLWRLRYGGMPQSSAAADE